MGDTGSVRPNGQNHAVVERFRADAALQARVGALPRAVDYHGSQFDAVFFPGGHGAMWDSGRLATRPDGDLQLAVPCE